jgi:acyl dehydratase
VVSDVVPARDLRPGDRLYGRRTVLAVRPTRTGVYVTWRHDTPQLDMSTDEATVHHHRDDPIAVHRRGPA